MLFGLTVDHKICECMCNLVESQDRRDIALVVDFVGSFSVFVGSFSDLSYEFSIFAGRFSDSMNELSTFIGFR
jgi:hypothetical protein